MPADDPPRADSTDSDRRSIGRRSLLGSLAAVGLAGCPGRTDQGAQDSPDGGAADTDTSAGNGGETGSESGDGSDGEATDGVPDDGTDGETDRDDWEVAADERIREHRTSALTVEVVDSDGDPVEGAAVEVAMREHDFGFGTAVDAGHLLDETGEGDPYREHVTDLFNLAVLGNHHKWRFWEEERETADGTTEWLLERGFDLRGHVCLWANVSAWAVPPDVVRAMGVEWADNGVTDPELDPQHVRQRSLEHVAAIVDHYGEDIAEWEVANEVVHQPGFVKAVNGVAATEETSLDDVDPVEAPILAEWYGAAREAAPEGTPLAVNDYNTLAGPYESTRADYARQIGFLADSDAGLDAVGLQCHFNRDAALTPEQVVEGLDRYAAHDVRLRITEFDMADDGWPEEEKAEFFRSFLKAAFSHPAVDQFLVWGILDDLHWRDDAPFFASGWEEKPALAEYRDLVFGEWWTEESGETDPDGAFSAVGFKGEYGVTATVDGAELSDTVMLGDGGATVELAPE
ncbi:endo-1,4-beta-xylanase [Halosimplex sp. J119]